MHDRFIQHVTRHIAPSVARRHDAEEGSMIAEYGLVAVVGATVAAVAMAWARGGAVTSLLSALLREVRSLVGA